MNDLPDNQCEGHPYKETFCYEFWERVAIDTGDEHLTLAEEKAAEFDAIISTRKKLCAQCKKQKEKES